MPEPMGFFTDTTVCIGCKACEVACKEWNQLPAANGGATTLSGDSYDNTRRLDGLHWRHVKFVEQFTPDRSQGRWLLMSDVCKHCVQAGCLEVCPTGAILRTEFDTVVIQSDVCIAACPFGVIDINPVSGTAQKCTLCYDRMQVGLEPACAKACPTDSIQFGPIAELKTRAGPCRAAPRPGRGTRPPLRRPRHDAGRAELVLLLVDRPEVYGLPPDPKLPSRNLARSSWFSVLGGVLIGLAGLVSFRTRGRS
jgi:formate dehydrogenase iron-sulfur subunit